jgi:threonine dehydrogenase-like Zn-dependent dehydrogenase
MLALPIGNGCMKARQRPEPRARQGQALIGLLSRGICNTDLELVRGY